MWPYNDQPELKNVKRGTGVLCHIDLYTLEGNRKNGSRKFDFGNFGGYINLVIDIMSVNVIIEYIL